MIYQPSDELAQFLKLLPKTETHLHIEGALPFHLLQKKFPEKYRESPLSWKDNYKFKSFYHFETELLSMAGDWFTSELAYGEAAHEIFHRLYEDQNVHYIETSFASGMIEFMNLDGSKVAQAIKESAHPNQEVEVFMGIHHDGYTNRSKRFLDDCHRWDALSGIDLHGTETVPIEPWCESFWKKAGEAGLLLKAHAGEFCGPEFIEWVLDHLGVKRIQHGVRAIEDPNLVERLVRENGVLDVCPISNVKLDVVASMADHPIRRLFDAGVTCTINTDDPISFGNQLHEEYTALYQELNFSLNELAQLAINGFKTANLSDEIKTKYIESIEGVVTSCVS